MPVDMIQLVKMIIIHRHVSGQDRDTGFIFPVFFNNQVNGFRNTVPEEEELFQFQRIPGDPGVVRMTADGSQQDGEFFQC